MIDYYCLQIFFCCEKNRVEINKFKAKDEESAWKVIDESFATSMSHDILVDESLLKELKDKIGELK